MKSFASLALFACHVAAQTAPIPGTGSSTGFCSLSSSVSGEKIDVKLECPTVVRATRAYFGRCLLLPSTGTHVWGALSQTTNAGASGVCIAGSSCAADGLAPSLFAATTGANDAKITVQQADAKTAYTWAKTWEWTVDQATIIGCAALNFNSGVSTDPKSFTSTQGNTGSNIWAQTWISLANDDNLNYQPRNLDSKFLIRLGQFTGFWRTDFTAAVGTTVEVIYQNTNSAAASLQATLTLHDGSSADFKAWTGAVKNGDLLGYTVSIANSPIDSDLFVSYDQVKFCSDSKCVGGAVVDQLLLGQGVYDNAKPLIQARGVVVVAFPFAVQSTWTFQVTGTLTAPGCSKEGAGPIVDPTGGTYATAWADPASPGFLYDIVGGVRTRGANTPACSAGRRFLLQVNGDSFAGSSAVAVDEPLLGAPVSSASSATLSAAVLLVAAALL